MMTGHTEHVIDGSISTLAEFARECATSFLHDCNTLPRQVPATAHYMREKLKKAQEDLRALEAMTTRKEREQYGRKMIREGIEGDLETINAWKAQNKKLRAMLKLVNRWDCPEELTALRDYMRDQLQSSRMDLSGLLSHLNCLRRFEPLAMWEESVKRERGIAAYHQEKVREEEEKIAKANAWLKLIWAIQEPTKTATAKAAQAASRCPRP